uniref:MABP1/WDR62 second WD40 domain-containing protein n=1 Tax=Anopheles gambiae TaxID=7165 RepID=A0ABK8FRX5_ANOGA
MFAPRNSSPPLQIYNSDEVAAYQIKLKKILGLTVCSSAGLDVSSTTGVLAYPAGCTVVLFNSKKLSQNFLLNTTKKAITAVAYSECGRYLATGECGHNPSIKVWELDASGGPGGGGAIENGTAGSIVAEFSGHKYAVSCVAFSPTGKYLVSVGSQHDNIVNVFDWKANLKIASNKVTAKVVAVSFSEDGNYFVTVGNRHVKYWYLEGSRKYKEPIPLMGRSAILGELRNNDFCAVACGKGEMAESTYAITRNGHLVEFNARRLLDKWVMCRTNAANCMVASTKYILVGCAEAIVRVFNAETLEYITTLPRTHFLGVDVAQGVHINHMMAVPQNAKYPDTIAIVYDEARSKVTCVYNDHSLYIWDLRDIRRVGKSQSFLYHSACIWGVETVPFSYQQQLRQHNGGAANGAGDTLPSDCFMTCSSDDTIRVWDVDSCETNEVYRKNIYSKELLKVLYIDDELNFIKDTDNPIHSTEKNSSYDGRNGVRCIKISPDSRQLATGDRSGNIRIYNLSNLKLITTIEAHDSEVLCLEYTNEKIERRLLASASRDRLIHIFDCEANYRILQTLDDHSSSITSVRFIGAGKQFQMVSCGADKSIIFRHFQNNVFLRGNNCSGKNTLYDMEVDSNSKHILTACQDRNIRVYSTQNAKHTKTFKGSHSDEGSLIKVSLDLSGIYIATSCTDKTLSVYDYYSNECMARMYGHSELVTGLKFTNDCKYLISASGDGCVFIWQVPHDMIVTMQARLSQQALRSGLQPIPRTLQPTNPFTDAILNHPQPTPPAPSSVSEFGSPPNSAFLVDDAPGTPGYRFSDVGQLPQWAKRKPSEDLQSSSPVLGSSPSQTGANFGGLAPKPRGRWGQKGVGGQLEDPFDLRNIVESSPLGTTFVGGDSRQQPTTPQHSATAAPGQPIHPPATNTPTSGYNSSGSKDVYSNAYLSEDSSIDSGRENRRPDLSSFLHKKITETKALNSLNSESNTEHDGDVEDISDGERTSSDHGMVYYPSAAPSTPTDFKINEIDTNELRKSIRRQKLEKQGLSLAAQFQSAASGTGTGTSDDEDEGSTPSGDNADRSLASTLGGSSESIPQQTSSTFLQAVLDGPGSLSDRERSQARKSMSAKHNNDAKITTSISKSFANNKKEELMKVINEAKAKLENVGYRSGLRASHSISDLSHSMNMSGASPNRTQRIGGNPRSLISAQDSESSIRRACSLSDLSMGKGYKSPNQSTAGSGQYKPSVSNRNTSTPTRNTPKRSTSSVGKGGASLSTGMGVRSISVGMLNQASDSEAEPAGTRGGLLKPTISSQNKINGTGNGTGPGSGGKYINPRSAAGIINRRKGLQNAYSSVNISTAGQDESSSEESPTSTVSTVPAKPAVPPRPRSIAFEHKRIANASQLNVKKTVTVGGTTTIPADATTNGGSNNNGSSNNGAMLPVKDADLDNADLTNQLCTNIINQLVQTTSTVIQLHQRLKSSDEASINGRNNSLMLKELENAVIMTQNMLTKVTNRNHNDGINNNSMSNNTNNQIMYEKCVDMLNQVQKHVNNNG